ncbi:MAG: DUF1501 domain-containing protein [Spongiibacteraceae bacterium]
MTNLKRRQFLNAMLGAGTAASFGGATSIFPSLAHAASPQFDDYKALVVLFLFGGNDSYNMVIPAGSAQGTGYATYAASRGDMAVNNIELNPLGQRTDDGSNRYAAASDADAYRRGVYKFGNEIGVNGMMPELAQLFRDGHASAVANIGTLIEPVNKASLQTAKLPPFLYAHNHQQRAMETGWADNLSAGGWAGRMADMWAVHEGGVNGGSPLGLNVSYGGATRMMTADYNSPVVLKSGSSSLFSSNSGFNQQLFGSLNGSSAADHPLRRVLKEANRRTVTLSDTLSGISSNYFQDQGLVDPYDNPLFSKPDAATLSLNGNIGGGLLRAADSAAQMIKLGSELNLGRQIIFIGMGGFDNHSNLLSRHPLLLRELSLALWSFQQAVDNLNLSEQVSLCTLSDFGRSLGNNGDGTDHAWAGHNLVMGGAINGGKLIGAFPDMTLGGDNDTGNKGRMIPSIAVDQYLATLSSWFGVSDDDMSSLYPNLANFQAANSNDISSAYIPGMLKSGDSGVVSPGDGGGSLIPIIDLLNTP